MSRSYELNRPELNWGNPHCRQCQEASLFPKAIYTGVFMCRQDAWYHSSQVSHWIALCFSVHLLLQILHLSLFVMVGPGFDSISPAKSNSNIRCLCLFLLILCFHWFSLIFLDVIKIEVLSISFVLWWFIIVGVWAFLDRSLKLSNLTSNFSVLIRHRARNRNMIFVSLVLIVVWVVKFYCIILSLSFWVKIGLSRSWVL